MHHDDHAGGLGPPRHLGRDVGILHAGDADLADQPDAGRRHLAEVVLGEAGLQQHRSGVDLHAFRAQLLERGMREDREGPDAGRIGRTAGQVRFAR